MILEIARIESGTTALQLKAEDINTLFHTVNTVFEEDIRKKNLKYSADLDVYHTFIFSFIEIEVGSRMLVVTLIPARRASAIF